MERVGSDGWTQIDRAPDGEFYVQLLANRAEVPHIVARRRRTAELLEAQAGQRLLEVGCGTGDMARDLTALVGPAGRVVGLDQSATLIDECRQAASESDAHVEYQVGDAHHLDFADNSFDGCTASMLLIHLDDPQQAVAEMARVTQPGGGVVLTEPDRETRTIDTANYALTRRILNFVADSRRDGWVGRRLYGLCKAAGLLDVLMFPTTIILTELVETNPIIIVLRSSVRQAQDAGVISPAEASAWWDDLEARDQAGRFFLSITEFTARGHKPATA